MDLKILLIVIVMLVVLDKGITAINIIQVNKKFPSAMEGDKYKVEKNPMAKWFFQRTGLFWGSLLYGLMSILTLLIAFYLLNFAFGERVALYIIMMVYGLVIVNNIYFLLKYSAVIS